MSAPASIAHLSPDAYRRSLRKLDMRRALRVLAAEHAERMAAPKAPLCSCGPHSWGDPAERRCSRCGHDLEARES